MEKQLFRLPFFSLSPATVLLFLGITGFLLYHHTFDFPPDKLDENVILVKNLNHLIKRNAMPEEIVRKDAFLSEAGIDFYRPVQNLSFWTDAKLSANGSYQIFRLNNLFLHILSSWLLYLILGMLIINPVDALLLSVIFLVHPLQTQTVLWLPARGDLLCTTFILLSFYLFLHLLKNPHILILIFGFLSFTVAIFSKETAAVFPLICAGYLTMTSKKPTMLTRLFLFLCSISILVYLMVRSGIISDAATQDKIGFTVLLNNWKVIFEITAKILFPFRQSPMPVFTHAVTFTGLGLSLTLIIIIFLSRQRIILQLIGTGLLWYLLFLLPGMAFSVSEPRYAYHYLEHRAYLPLSGFVIFTSGLINCTNNKITRWFLFFLIPVFAFLTLKYSEIFKDAIAFYSRAIQYNSTPALALNNRGLAYHASGKTSDAILDYSRAIELRKNFFNAYFNRATAYLEMKYYHEAERDYTHSLNLAPHYADAWHNRGVARYNLGDYTHALADFTEALKRNPGSVPGYYNKGLCENALHNYDSAIVSFTRALALSPAYADAYNSRGIARYYSGQVKPSIEDYTHAIELQPGNAQPYYNRGLAYMSSNNLDAACADWHKSLTLMPDEDVRALIKRYCKEE